MADERNTARATRRFREPSGPRKPTSGARADPGGSESPGKGAPARLASVTAAARTAAQLLVDCLAVEGCEYVFSVPGEETMDILDALGAAASRDDERPAPRHAPATSRARPSWPTFTVA